VATYLMAVTVSPFTVSSTGYTKSTSPFETIPVEYYVWKADSAIAAGFLPTVVDMIDFYAGIFGEYPYDKYGMSGIAPFAFGGMEHTNITTLRRNYVTNVGVVAHELVHQWWGDLVTCGTWADIWLNEGFATYGDALYSEHTGGSQALQTRMNAFAQSVFNYDQFNRHPIYDPLEYTSSLFNVNEYQKGAWVLHMLRGLLGDSPFFSIFPAYGEKFRFGNAVTDDFIAFVDSLTGQDFFWFFDQWVYGQGYPEYEYSWSDLGGTVRIIVDQTQTNAPVFKMPVEFLIQTAGGDVTEAVWDSLTFQQFEFAVSGPVTGVTFDPNNKILKKVMDVTTGAPGHQPLPVSFLLHQNYPNPFNPTTMIEYDVPRRSFVTVAVYDLLGRKVADLVSQVLEPGFYRAPFSAEGLASGVYFCRLEAVDLSTNATIRATQTRSMVIIR
ncbi:MAG TPA: M1 family aminopeptidase, partial [Bacteroidota bacterium]